MAIKYNNKQVKVVKFDNNDVKKIIKDSITVWEKPYTLTELAVDPTVVTYKWKATEEPSATLNGTISKTKVTENVEYKATVYNEDTVTLTYNTDISKGAVADIIRVNGNDVTAASTDISISDNVDVEVIAAGKPATLNLTMDLGADYAYVRYIDTDGQQRKAYFDEAATHTISNIWQGTTVEYWWYPDAGHTPKSGSPDPKITHKFIANASQSINLETTLKPVKLSISWSSDEGVEIESVTVRYTDVNDVEQTKIVTSPGTIATDVKFRTQYYWTINPKQGSEAVFKYLEDYDVAERNNNTIGIDVDWKPCRIRIDWTQLAPEVSSVRLKYRSAESNGILYERLYRNSAYSDVEGARCGTTAQLLDFKFTKTGCRVDPLDPDAYKTLSDDPKVTNIFTGLTVEVLDLDERETPVSFTVPSDYEKVEITYINTEGKEVTVEVTGGSKIEDMAEGSYIHYSASTKGGTTYSGYLHSGYDWTTGSSTTSSVTIPSESTIKKRPARPGDNYVYTWNESAWAWEKVKVETPRRRTVNITVNENVGQICMSYYSVDDNDYLMHYSYRRFSTNDSVTALAGRSLSWHLHNSTIGGQTTPDRESFNPLRESKNPLVIAPTWTLAYGSIHLVFGENISTITVKYYNTLTNQKEVTISYTNAVSGLYDITDAVLGKHFTWSATSKDGMVLDRDHGSGYADPDYVWLGAVDGRADRCAIIAPEVDTEPVKIYFSGEYADWMSTKLEAALNEQLIATYNGSSAAIECKTKQGVSRWYNQVDRLQDTDSRVYTGDASFDKTFPIILNSTTAPWNDSTRKYELRINTNGYSLIDRYQVSLDGTGIEWKINNEVVTYAYAFAGDYMSVSGTTLTCRMWGSTGAIRWQATASKKANTDKFSYNGNVTCTLQPPATVTGDYTYTATGVTVSINKYPVIFNPASLTGVTSLFLSTNNKATSGSASGAEFEYDATVYGIAKISETNAGKYNLPSGWVYRSSDGSYRYYEIGSCKVIKSTAAEGKNAIRSSNPTAKNIFTISFTGDYVIWKNGSTIITSMSAYFGDTITQVNSTTMACCYPDSLGNLCERWRVTVSRNANTAQYTYTGTVGAPDTGISFVDKDATITASGVVTRTTNKYAITYNTPVMGTPFLSTSASATSGYSSGTTFEYGSTVYCIVKATTSVANAYTLPSGWTKKSSSGGFTYYLVGSFGVTGTYAFSIADATPKKYTLTLPTTYVTWATGGVASGNSLAVYGGDQIICSGATLSCSSHAGLARFTVTATRNSNTAQYNYSGTPLVGVENASSITVTSNVTATVSGVSRALRTYAISFYSAPIGNTYLATTNTDTSGSTSGTSFNYGTTVYCMVRVVNSTLTVYELPDTWVKTKEDGTYTYFQVGSKTVTGTYTFSIPAVTPKPVTITLKESNVAVWKLANKVVTSMQAYAGDTLTKQTTSNTAALICSYLDSNGNLAQRWKVNVVQKANDAQYTYKLRNWDFVLSTNVVGSGTITVTAPSGQTTTNSYKISITKPSFAEDAYVTTVTSDSSGSASASFNYGQTVYGIVKVSYSNAVKYKISDAGWSQTNSNGQYNWYRVGSVKVTGTASISYTTPAMKTATVTIASATEAYSMYLSTSSSATSGKSSGSTYNYGDTVYGFAKVLLTNSIFYDYAKAGWTHITNDSTYSYYRTNGYVNIADNSSYVISYTNWSLKPKKVNVTAPSYVSNIYTSTNSGATSGNASGYEYARGRTVYAFGTIDTTYFTAKSTWTRVGTATTGKVQYRMGSVVVDSLKNATAATISTGNAIGKEVTITFGSTDCVTWICNGSTATSRSAYNGDTLTASGNGITCKDQSGSTRWIATASRRANDSNYTYSGTPVAYTPVSTVMGSTTVSVTGVYREASGFRSIVFAGEGVSWSNRRITIPSDALGAQVSITKGSNTVKVTGASGMGQLTTYGSSTASAMSGYKLKSNSITVTNGAGKSINQGASGTKSIEVVGVTTIAATATKQTTKLTAPSFTSVSTEVNDGTYSANPCDYTVLVTVKNPNSVAVTATPYADVEAFFSTGSNAYSATISAGGTAKLVVFGDAGDEYSVEFTASGYTASDTVAYVTAPSSGGGQT